MFAGDDFEMSAKASGALGKPADSVRSDTALDCAKGMYVCGDQGTEIYFIRCSEPGYIRGALAISSLEEPYPRIRSHAAMVPDAIWKKVCGR